MAPNLAVRSDSWIDLTRTATNDHLEYLSSSSISSSHHQQQQQQRRHQKQRPEEVYLARNVRHSMSEQREQTTTNKLIKQLKSTTSRPASVQVMNYEDPPTAGNRPISEQNSHLLIRLRQQSYLNRSSNSLASNLSASVDLNPSLAGGLSLDLSECRNQARQPRQVAASCEERPALLKSEPRRLSFIRNKLQGNRATRKMGVGAANAKTNLEPREVGRSWSSLSERLADKLSHFRHSWKHLLHSYSNQVEELDGDTRSEVQCFEQPPPPEAVPVDKRRLTDEWISRHQWQDSSRSLLAAIKYRNLLSGRTKSTGRHLSAHKLSQSTTTTTTTRSDLPLDSDSKPKSLDISPAAPKQQQQPATGWSPDNEHIGGRWTRTDLQFETRVSQQQQHHHYQQQQRTCRLSSNSSSKPQSPRDSSSSTTLVSQQQQLTNSKQEAPHLSASDSLESIDASSSSSAGKMQPSRSPTKLELPAPQQQQTSDYWSTVASSDYYKQHLHLQQQQQQQQTQSQMSDQVLINQQSSHLPMLSNDQEYYLDVASASAMESQQQQQQQQQLLRPQVMNHLELPAQHDDDYDDYAVPSDESYRLERSQVELVQMIGEGQKGYVFLGKLQSRDGSQIIDVAIKTLKYETEQLIEKLMREAAMMRQFEHPHIIKFIGVCPETPALIAMELAQFGEIKQYLESNRQLISVSQLVLFTFQISTALSYLESKQYVHRDVAARNVLVCSHSCVKLADFGLSRNLQLADQQLAEDSGHYVCASRGKLPVRWLAPESLAFRRFTSASDVWMFAVCSWELFQFGQVRPWANIRNNQVLAAIELGQRLARPTTCPLRLYQLMLQCWSYAPGQRPKFRELKQSLWSIYLNERAQEQLQLEQQQQQEQQQRLLAKQHQERLLLLVNNSRLQQVSSPPGAGHPQQVNHNHSHHHHHHHHNHQQQQQHLHQACSPTAHLAASYSSTAATATTTDNSSRSSSMGSLARSKQQKQPGWQVCQLPAARQVAVSPSPSPDSRAITSKQQQQQQQQQAVDRNMRRFQRGHRGQALQKQRSQGSIVTDEMLAAAQRRPQFGLDDHALLNSRQARQQRALFAATGRQFADDGAEADEDSSEPELTTVAASSPLSFGYTSAAGMRLAPPPGIRVPLAEPAYEGLQEAVAVGSEIAMVRGERSPTRGNVMMVRPLSWRQPTVPPPNMAAEPPGATAKFGQKLERALQSMSATPMKARLARQRSVEPSGAAAAAASDRATKATPDKSPASSTPEPNAQNSAEEQRQLALHQRILGHIRRSTGSPKSPRKPVPQSPQPPSSRAETVDQSLQLLESLIGGGESASGANSSSNSSRRPSSRHAHQPRRLPDYRM